MPPLSYMKEVKFKIIGLTTKISCQKNLETIGRFERMTGRQNIAINALNHEKH